MAIVAAFDNGQSAPAAPAINLNEPEMKKHTVEVRIGHDEDDRWWVVIILDARNLYGCKLLQTTTRVVA